MFITDFEISFMLLKVFNHVFSHDFSSFVRDVFFSQVFRKWKKSLPYKAVIDYMFMLLVGYAPTKLVQLSYVDTIQDFVCELGMKPHVHLANIKKKSYYYVIVRPTKIMQRRKKLGTFFAENVFKNLRFQTKFIIKSWSPSPNNIW